MSFRHLRSLWSLVASGPYDFDLPVRVQARRGLRVLDIGAGDNPRLIADVIANNVAVYEGSRAVAAGGRFYIADVERLPFRDGAFDLAIANHVLEHVPHPDRALAEMARVAENVLVVTPSALREAQGTSQDHFWFVYGKGGRLVFEAIPEGFRFNQELRRDRLERFTGLANDLGKGDETIYHRASADVEAPILIGSIDEARREANLERYAEESDAPGVSRLRPKKRIVFGTKSLLRRCVWAVRRPLDPDSYLLPADERE